MCVGGMIIVDILREVILKVILNEFSNSVFILGLYSLCLQREESLNNLKAVFSPKGSDNKSSNRRKLPIFCATGNKPHLVSQKVSSLHYKGVISL